MKQTNRTIIVCMMLIAGLFSTASAQQVSTLYFLENAPMRHIVNPAFQPVSDGYVNFTPLGYTSMWVGNNSLTVSDAIQYNNGTTVTALHPDLSRDALMKQFRKVTLTDGDITLDLLSFGFRHKEKGYIHIGIMERVEMGVGLPKTYFDFALDGGMHDISGVNTFDLTKTSFRVNAYTEIAGGYSYVINEKWTVGGKIKFLLGQANATMLFNQLTLDASAAEWHFYGDGNIQGAAPIRWAAMPQTLSSKTIQEMDASQLIKGQTISDYLKPQGYGLGFDLGFTYKPHPQVQITAALNDLGFIAWKGANYTMAVDSAFVGVNGLKYSDYSNAENNYTFDSNKLTDDVLNALNDFSKCLHTTDRTSNYARMLSAKLNVGVDANFCNNILGVGIVSKTRLFNQKLYEEVTIGGAVRPCNWFNFALSYSLVNNGKYSNFGAGLSFMPYDGVNMTLAMDYIPTSYAEYNGRYCIPYKAKGVNVALGFSIVWGTNKKKDADKDGVLDKFDLCPDTPINVAVDEFGCPKDTDGDGIPDYLDKCKNTPAEAIAYIDSTGCEKDSDNDGVPDYLDKCPNDSGAVNNNGCPIMKEEEKVVLTKYIRGIEFELGKSVIKTSSYPALNKIAKFFIKNPTYTIEIQGHTDNTGSREINDALSQERAKVVMNYLLKAGVPASQMTAAGYADTKPVATNKTEEGRAKNRRVTFKVSYAGGDSVELNGKDMMKMIQ